MARISFPTPDNMSVAQRKVYDTVVSGPRGRVVGPLRVVIHNADLAHYWQNMGRILRYETSIPLDLNELVILVTARRWTSNVEWAIHKKEAIKAGLALEIITAIELGELPNFENRPAAAEVYEFSRQILESGNVSDVIYSAIIARWGEVGAVELSSVVGYYSLVAMTLNIHQVPLPKELSSDLTQPETGLTTLPTFEISEG